MVTRNCVLAGRPVAAQVGHAGGTKLRRMVRFAGVIAWSIVNAVNAAFVVAFCIVTPWMLAVSSEVFAMNSPGAVRLTPVAMSPNEAGAIESASTPNENWLMSPGVHEVVMSPLTGVHTFSPCLSTTVSAIVRLQSRLVGRPRAGVITRAGPRASKPPWAGTSWLPDGVQ